MKSIVILVLLAGCLTGEHRDARDKYNEGVGQLVKGDYEAAEKALLDARSGAGVDPELRFRAAYDLGMAYATHADKTKGGKDADLAKALEQEQEAISWFSDALRLRPSDADTIANLAVVRARAQAIADDLRKGENKLEARLDAVMKDQRGVLDEARGAWLTIKQGGGADPLAEQAVLTKLADRERGIVAEVGTIGDLASDEIDAIGKKKDDKREPKEQARMVQLKNLDLYLLDARARIAEARRKLQELAAQDGVARAEAALAALKRAREQLLDPIAVLGEVARDEVQMVQEARAAAPAEHGLAGVGSAAPAAAAVPAWLEPGAMAERQSGLRDRLEEVRARMAAGVEGADRRDAAGSGASAGSGEPPAKPLSAEEHEVIERVRTALPFIGTASSAMQRAQVAFTAAKTPDAIVAQTEALVALERAIEEFSDLKQVIELAYDHHEETLGYLSPEAAKDLAPAERARKTLDAVTANRARLDRITGLLAEKQAQLAQQKAQLEAKLAQGAGSGSAAAPDGAAARAQLAQADKQMQTAEQLRAEAATALAALDTALAKNTDPMPPAKDAEAKLSELRQLFFSVVEHLKELVRTQGETRDRTAAEVTEDDLTRAPKLPALIAAQDHHLGMAKAITDALAKQADEAGKQAAPPPGQGQGPTKPQQGPDPKALAGAADEVRKAQTDMSDAHTAIDKSQKATNVSVPLQPAVDSQGKALEHLEAALKLLEPPPKKNDQDKDQQKQDPQKQEQQKQDKPKQEQPKPQPQGGAGQRARDDDARRQQRKGSASEPVDKDW